MQNAPTPGLRVGYVPGVILTKWRRVWAERFPGVPLETVEVAEPDQRRVLDADVDLVFARLPLDEDGLHVIRLWEERPVVWVAKDHPISLYDEITLADLADENVIEHADEFGIDLVALGEAVLRVPMSVAREHSRRDLAYRPVTDAEPTTIALVWRRDNEHPLIQEFVGIVRGRTANSSRTAQERGGATPKLPPKPRAQAQPRPRRPRSSPPGGRRGGRGRPRGG